MDLGLVTLPFTQSEPHRWLAEQLDHVKACLSTFAAYMACI
jgi:hypothetical protein